MRAAYGEARPREHALTTHSIAVCDLSLARIAVEQGQLDAARDLYFAAYVANPNVAEYADGLPKIYDSFGGNYLGGLALIGSALAEQTGAILVVHPSNYRVRGFTAEVELQELSALARRAGVPLVYDLGGGVLCDLAQGSLPAEPVLRREWTKGADLVTFSGDKVLGGPQAGLLAGARTHIEAIRKNALMRALRCDKLVYAALEATLALYRLRPDVLCRELPVLRMLCAPLAELEARAVSLAAAINGTRGDARGAEGGESISQAGSGALPLEEIARRAVALTPQKGTVAALARALRTGDIAVVGRVEHARLLLDMRTITEEDMRDILTALGAALA